MRCLKTVNTKEPCKGRVIYGIEYKTPLTCSVHRVPKCSASNKGCTHKAGCIRQTCYGLEGKCHVNVVNKRCAHAGGCIRQTCYGLENKPPIYCGTHAKLYPGYTYTKTKQCENCKKKTALFCLPWNKSPNYCGKCAPKGFFNVKAVQCKHKKCTTQRNFGKPGGKAEFCEKHASEQKDEYINVNSPKCEHPNGCKTTACFGIFGTKSPKYCYNHKPYGYANVVSSKCVITGCNKQQQYGKINDVATHCGMHGRPKGFVNIFGQCETTDCYLQKSWGDPETKTARFCKDHAIKGYINLKGKVCIKDGCNSYAYYRKKRTDAVDEYCRKHAPDEYINPHKEECLREGCFLTPSYGEIGTLARDYCKTHAPDSGYVNNRDAFCQHKNKDEKCNQHASFELPGTKTRIYCNDHAPKEYHNVKTKRCEEKDCQISAGYGKKNTRTKQYCVKHAPPGYTSIHQECTMEKCTTRAQYGPMLGIKIRCGQHKLPGDVIETQTCEVSKCCNYPLYAPEGEYVPRRCKQHAKNTVYINVSEIECLSCKQKDFVNKNSKMCPNCHQYDKRVRKEIQIKDLFDKAGIEYDTHDKIYNGSCLRYRPDFVFKYNDRFIIVEVDEDQHKRYPCECDQIRMINLCQDFGGAPVVFIRFNPDKYKSFDGKLKKSKIDKRFPDLLKYIDIIKHMPVSSILTVAYLFYDGYDPDHRDIITINNFKSTVIERLKF